MIASAASATAAIVVSTFWRSGTPIAAAVTPVIVTLVSEMLHRPTAAIAERVTVSRDALPRIARQEGQLPPEARLTRPSREPRKQTVPDRGPREPAPPGDRPPARPAGDGNGEMRVYSGSGTTAPGPRPNIPWKAVVVTAALAFAIGATVLTVPELLAGGSVGSGGGHTTIFGGSKHRSSTGDTNTSTTDNQDQQKTTTEPQRTTTQPQSTTKTTPRATTPKQQTLQRNQTQTAPTTTTPAPKKAPAQP